MYTTQFYFPTEAEAAVFKTLRPDADVRIVGVGMATSGTMATAYVAAFAPKRIVLCGIAGACDDSLEIGQVVEVVRDSEAGLPEAYAEFYEMKPATGLTQVESFTVSHSGDSLRFLTEKRDLPCIEQMEGAAVAAASQVLDPTEFYHLRAISNRVGDDRSKWQVGEAIAALGAVAAQLFKDE
ncbi:MAG: hypothetical protein J6L75_01775 [Alistipes sp.]|nr:hypothetical protein [Alistipes sp.]